MCEISSQLKKELKNKYQGVDKYRKTSNPWGGGGTPFASICCVRVWCLNYSVLLVYEVLIMKLEKAAFE